MEKRTNSISNSALMIIIIASCIFSVKSEPTNFDYEHHGSDWAGDCTKNASQQSPVILPALAEISSDKTSYIFADFRSTPATATTYNTTLYIKPSNSTTFFGEIYTKTPQQQSVPFKASEIRIRIRSEHRISDEKGFKDLQVQIAMKELYDSSKNIKLSVGLLFQADPTSEGGDPFLEELIKNAKATNESFDVNVDLSHLLSRTELFDFWFYQGSTTYPPCSNGKMNWIIPNRVFPISQSQLDFFKKLYPEGNWRDTQPLNGNQISYSQSVPSELIL